MYFQATSKQASNASTLAKSPPDHHRLNMSSATSTSVLNTSPAPAAASDTVMSRAGNDRASKSLALRSSETLAAPVPTTAPKGADGVPPPKNDQDKVASKESSADMASCDHLSPSVDSSAAAGSCCVSLSASILSKASTLITTKKDDVNNETTNETINEHDHMSSSVKSEIDEEEDSSVPAYVAASSQPAGTIFAVRKKELHFLSDTFFQQCQSWLQDDNSVLSSDDDQSDMEEDQDEDDWQMGPSTDGINVEYAGRTNFNPSNDRYRKSQEMSALSFAETLLGLSDDESDSDDDE